MYMIGNHWVNYNISLYFTFFHCISLIWIKATDRPLFFGGPLIIGDDFQAGRVAVPRCRHQRQNKTQQAKGQRDHLDLSWFIIIWMENLHESATNWLVHFSKCVLMVFNWYQWNMKNMNGLSRNMMGRMGIECRGISIYPWNIQAFGCCLGEWCWWLTNGLRGAGGNLMNQWVCDKLWAATPGGLQPRSATVTMFAEIPSPDLNTAGYRWCPWACWAK